MRLNAKKLLLGNGPDIVQSQSMNLLVATGQNVNEQGCFVYMQTTRHQLFRLKKYSLGGVRVTYS